MKLRENVLHYFFSDFFIYIYKFLISPEIEEQANLSTYVMSSGL